MRVPTFKSETPPMREGDRGDGVCPWFGERPSNLEPRGRACFAALHAVRVGEDEQRAVTAFIEQTSNSLMDESGRAP
jgi:hypothetical protein